MAPQETPSRIQAEDDGRTPSVGLHRMVPNLMTLTALAAGLTAIQYALNESWERAIIAILIATVFDALDGATARLLKAQSEFGAQLDSLSDFLAFGIAPAIILHSWVLEDSGRVGWMAMIIYAAAAALRLARFNVTQKALPKWKIPFFSGIPSPAGAGLAMLPLILWVQLPDFFEQFAFLSPLVGLWLIFVAGLMVSRIPTYSTKALKIPAKMSMPALALAALIMASLVHLPWLTLTTAAILYMISIPLAVISFRRLQKEHEDNEDMADLALGAAIIDEMRPLKNEDQE